MHAAAGRFAAAWPGGSGADGTARAAVSRRHARGGATARSALDFAQIYQSRFHDVVRWMHALGVREDDLEDLAQEVFIIVRRQLSRFDGANLNGWLYRMAQRTARDYRRTAWFRSLLGGRRAGERERALLVDPGRSPADEHALSEAKRALQLVLSRMSEKHRTAFVLFELEGYTGSEIAQLHGVPTATIFTRLHHARRELAAIINELTRRQQGEPEPIEDRVRSFSRAAMKTEKCRLGGSSRQAPQHSSGVCTRRCRKSDKDLAEG